MKEEEKVYSETHSPLSVLTKYVGHHCDIVHVMTRERGREGSLGREVHFTPLLSSADSMLRYLTKWNMNTKYSTVAQTGIYIHVHKIHCSV